MPQRERARPGPVGEIFVQYPDCALVSATSSYALQQQRLLPIILRPMGTL